ncbi:MAG: hypothetical protein IPL65_05825 [Lewinellaceae bacterium]|nr:hypothetical protein [Lewinellaceae bacterium]
MEYSNRSLWFAVLACLAMGLYAKSPGFMGEQLWVAGLFFGATLILCGIGFYFGLKGAKQQRTLWAWLGPFINGFIFVAFLAFNILLFRSLLKLQ